MLPFFQNNWCKLYHGDCLDVMPSINESSFDLIMTSPPYNNSRGNISLESRLNHTTRYDVYIDEKPSSEYIDWTIKLFYEFDRLLCKDGVVIYNFCWGSDYVKGDEDHLDLWTKTLNGIVTGTGFHLAEMFCWKKPSAIPNCASPNGATRIWEPVMVFCRKAERLTFHSNKKFSSVSPAGQEYYSPFYNFINAPNNDGACDLNKATYSSELCYRMFELYCPEGGSVLDPFHGTGTTGVACKKLNCKYVGIELSEEQLKYSVERLEKPVQLDLI